MTMKTEKQKMIDGELYVAADPQLTSEREYARRCVRLFNQTTETDRVPDHVVVAGNPARIIKQIEIS
ncbi:hypothetical protein JYU28_01630 [Paenibacillus polymyxa]|nr:hypothetical protein [Paenibacillus polymyxa]